MSKVSKRFYVASWLSGPIVLGAAILFALEVGTSEIERKAECDLSPLVNGLVLFGVALLVYSGIIGLMLIFRMWAALPEGYGRATPARAVGYLLIPLFNFYWVFRAFWGWTQDYNKLREDRELEVPLMSEELGFNAAFLAVLTVIPFLGIVFAIGNVVVTTIFFARACDAINALAARLPQGRSNGSEPTRVPKSCDMAKVSFVLGICGFFSAGLSALAGVVFGILGLRKISRSGGGLKGRGYAVTGIILSLLAIALSVFIVCWAVTENRQAHPPMPPDPLPAKIETETLIDKKPQWPENQNFPMQTP